MLRIHSIALVLVLASIGASLLGCSPNVSTSNGAVGDAALAIVLDDGSAIMRVYWKITHPNGYHRQDEIDVSEPAATVSAYIGGIPEGMDYTIALTATTTADAACEGRAIFDVTAGEETLVSMTLQCVSADKNGSLILKAAANMCPTVDYLTASPLSQGLGAKIALTAEASDADTTNKVLFAWTAVPSDNAFDHPTASSTSFNCDSVGTYALTLTVRDGKAGVQSTCSSTKSIEVKCILGGVFDELHRGSILLGRPTDTSIAINVVSDINHLTPDRQYEVYFEYGKTQNQLVTHTNPIGPGGDDPIVVTLTGLSPDTKYYYRMRYRLLGDNDGEWTATEVRSFHTARPSGETFAFTIQSDSHLGHTQVTCDEALYACTVQNIIADEPDFHIDLGDTFINDLGNWFKPGVILGDMDSIYPIYLAQRRYLGAVGRTSPVFLVVGNHENEEGWNLDDTDILADTVPIMSQNARKRYYLNPVPNDFYAGAPLSLPEIEGDHLRDAYYAFRWGNALFVVIDPFWYTMVVPFTPGHGESEDEAIVGDRWSWTLGIAQYQWLKRTLVESDATFKLVFTHHLTGGGIGTARGYGRGGAEVAPYFEWGGLNEDGTWGFSDMRPLSDGWETPIHQLLEENRVNVVFHGHDHLFAKEELDGIVYQECPRPCDPNPNDDLDLAIDDYSAAIASGDTMPNSGHLRVTVSPQKVTVDYVSALSGDVVYTYTIDAPPAD